MSTIIDVLDKHLNCIQMQKINEMQSIVNRLKTELNFVNSLADQRKRTIETLESEKRMFFKQSMNSLKSKIKEILGMPQKVVPNDEEILSEIREYKSSTQFWRQKYHLLCADMESIAEKLEIEELGQQTDRTDVRHVLHKIQSFVKQIENLKTQNIRLCRQMEDKDKYCQTLIELRNKLSLEIDSLKAVNSIVTTERDSINEKCFWHNSLINAFQSNQTINSKLIQPNNLIQSKHPNTKQSQLISAFSVTEDIEDTEDTEDKETIFQTSTQSYGSEDSSFSTPEGKKIKYWLRSESKSTRSAQSNSPSGPSLKTNGLAPKEKRLRKESKVMSCRKLFITNV